jgi:hypothetical protein
MRCLFAFGTIIGLLAPIAGAQTIYGPATPPPVEMQSYPHLNARAAGLLHVLQEPSPRIEVRVEQINGDVVVRESGNWLRAMSVGRKHDAISHMGCDSLYFRNTEMLPMPEREEKMEEPAATQPVRQSAPVTNRRGVKNKAAPGQVVIIPMGKK